MDLVEKIDQHQYLALREIAESDIGILRVVIEEARADSDTQDIELGKVKIANVHPIVSGQCKYEVTFRNYVAYSVLNESYTLGSVLEEYSGRLFRTYSKSHFLDYARVTTFASDEYPGQFKHYGLICLDHILDVICVTEPIINTLRRT